MKDKELDKLIKELEKLNKKLDKEIGNIDGKDDEEIYQERLEEIKKSIIEVAENSKRVIVCIGDGGLMTSGTGLDVLATICAGMEAIFKKRKIDREIAEFYLKKVIENVYED